MRAPGIKTKLILAVSALVVVVLVATSFALFAYYERTTKERIGDAQFAMLALVASDIDDKLTTAHAELVQLARAVDPEVLRDARRSEAFLDQSRRIHAFFTNGMFFFDPGGTMIAETPQYGRRGTYFGFREYLATTLRTRKPYIGAPYRSSRPGSPPAIMMTAPVLDAEGELVGVLGGAVDLLNDSVLGRTVRLHNGKTGYFYIFDRQRTMILHPDPSRILKQDVPEGANKLLDLAIEGFEGTGDTVNSRNLRCITSFKRIGATDWIVGVNTPMAEAYAPIERARRTLIAVVAATLLAVTIVIWRLMNLLTKPLLAFTAHVESISRKQGLARRVPLASRDEIGHLAAAFNRMLADLDAKQLEVEAERERLGRAAHHWRATFDAIRDGLCVLDGDLRVLRANRAMHELLGAPPEGVEGRPIGELLGRVLDDPAGADLAAGRGRAVRHQGGRWLELQRDRIAAPGGEAAGYVQLLADVTQQQLLQERLTQAQKMEAVGQLAGGVAHDFNNVLSVILTFASSLREELPDGELRSFSLEIERAGHRAASLTRQLLAFSRKQVLLPQVLEVREVVGNLTQMIGRLIGEHIAFSVDLAGTAGHVRMDPSQLEQVLVNLAVNARDAMPGGGELTIEARDVDVDVAAAGAAAGGGLAPGAYVRIRVADSGTGMDEATLARIFEPFFTTKGKGKGTGLGLAMVYAAVEQSGGAIDVESEVGAGTTFLIHLPRVPAPPERSERPPSGASPRGEGERVLVVEDEPQLRATLSRFLSADGYEVIEAANGDEGLAVFRAQREHIDAVLTDLVMPGTGGIALGKAIREISAVPVLYMSGYSEEMASGKEHLGPEEFVQKPFERGALLGRLRAAIATARTS
jgi:two-component system cell cycle sensor histidine kinase/response regulator CckA